MGSPCPAHVTGTPQVQFPSLFSAHHKVLGRLPNKTTGFEMFNASSLGPVAAAFAFINSAFTLPTTDLLLQIKDTPQDTVPRLIQYVQTFHPENDDKGHLSLLPLLEEGTGITHVILAALHINGPNGNITLNDDSPNSTYYDQTWSEVKTLQDHGVKVMVMMGGAATGSYDGALCNKQTGTVQDDYYLGLESTLKYHEVDGLDIDIEESVHSSCPGNLVERIRSDFGNDFIITMAPVASDLTGGGGSFGGFSYKEFDQSSVGQQVDWYNGQYYSGFVQGTFEDSYARAISNGFAPSRVVMGFLNSANDGGDYEGLNHIEDIIANLRSQYSNFGGVDGWEYFDAGSSDGLSQPWMWTKQVGETLFGSSPKNTLSRRGGRKHTAPIPSGVAKLMSEGHDQIAAATAMRLAKGDETAARDILRHS